MYELYSLLLSVPKPIRALAVVGLTLPVAYVLTGALGIQKYWWLVFLGMILIAVAVWAFNEFVRGRNKKKGAEFAADLEKDGRSGASREEVREALKELSQKWTDALGQLRTAKLDVYALPWYLLIGEPQSGKSTTLKNSGLEFPIGGDALSGSGGTRNCDWWFSNEAVILDTAGRFTFQEDAAPDAAEWSTFLTMLKKHRRQCPINGVLVVIPATSLLEDSPEEQDRKATNIRNKLLNLQRVLEIRFPVYIMVTKADRILGFSEFFTRIDPVVSKQLFGWSSPDGAEKGWEPEAFEASVDDVVTRVHKMRLRFSSTEENVSTVDRLFVFPEELRALKDPLKRYLAQIFQATRFDEPLAFRGWYLSSGIQQGRPIARATRELLGGAGEGVVENLEQIFKRSRAFFIRDFYSAKVFPEQGLTERTKAAREKERKTLLIAYGLSGLLVLLVILGMLPAWLSLKKVLNPIRQHTAEARECVEQPKGCSIWKAQEIGRSLWEDRDALARKRFAMAVFFRGAKGGELDSLLGRIQRRLVLERVAAPLLRETEARAAALSWEEPRDYDAFFRSLKELLRWHAIKVLPPAAEGTKPVATPADLKTGELVPFLKGTKGLKGSTELASQADEWAEKVVADQANLVLASSVASGMPDRKEWWPVPDPKRPVEKFEAYWTVENLARWDYVLLQILKRYARSYVELLAASPEEASERYLDLAATKGKEFRQAYEEAGRQLALPKTTKSGRPGVRFEEWERNLREDYDQILKFKTATNMVSEERRERILGQLKGGWDGLQADLGAFAWLVEDDPAAAGKKKWTVPAPPISQMLVDVTAFADVKDFTARENPKKLVDDALALSGVGDQKAKLDAFRTAQAGLRDKALAGLQAVPGIPSGQGDRFQQGTLSAYVPRTADLALVYRVLPWAQEFFGRTLDPSRESVIYQPAFARDMVPLGIGFIKFAEGSSAVGRRADVAAMADRLSQTILKYLQTYIDRYAGRRGGGGGGGGFSVPTAALSTRSWRDFQGVISRWNPEGGGGGGGEAAPAGDPAGALARTDLERWAADSTRLASILKYYDAKTAPARKARTRGGQQAPPEVIEASRLFKNAVMACPETPLEAWKALSLARQGASLKGYHAFSRKAAVKRAKPWGPKLVEVERKGANLVRDAIRPGFQQEGEPLLRRLQPAVQGQFPFVSEGRIRQERSGYAAGTALKKGGGPGGATWSMDLPTIAQTHLTGIMSEVGLLSDRYALDPILWGTEPDFDFVGEPTRSWFAVARGWERWVFTGPSSTGGGALRDHKAEIRTLQFTPAAGRRFLGERIGMLTLFDSRTILRPSTDIKRQDQARPFTWRLPVGDSAFPIVGKNEDLGKGWTGSLAIRGGPLRLFYFLRVAAEERDRTPEDDPDRLRERERTWRFRLLLPDAEKPAEPLEGLFEAVFDEMMPPVLTR